MKASRGFTLIEVMIALIILSMLMLTTLSAMRTFATTEQKLSAKLEAISSIRQTGQWLRQTLSQALPVRNRLREGNHHASFFQGDQQQITWVGPATFGVLGGVYIFHLYRADDKLWVQFSPYTYQNELPDWSHLPAQVLLEEVQQFQVNYRSRPGQEWLEEWELSLSSPAHVRLQIQQKERFWPEMIVRLNDGQVHFN